MGCLLTKRVPEVPKNVGSIKPVYSVSILSEDKCESANPSSADRNAKKFQESQKSTKKNPDIQNQPTDLSGDDPKSGTVNRKMARYKAKFDPRVTAKYDIKALIGRGTFSRVVRVEHRITRQPYAIKMVERLRGKDLFESELNVLRRVQHPNIIQLVEVFESKDKLYMVVDLATGGELFDRIITKGSFIESDACKVLTMVLDGLRYLHSLGITHRDLKPENLLYYHPGPDSKILITDFGLSAFRKTRDEFMSTICGTPEYIAPEVLARQPYTSQVDLWAVGVILYILLSGTMPFDDENYARLYRQILKAKYSYDGQHWKDVSSLAKNFIDGLLTVDPVKRMTAAESLKHPWLTTPTQSSKDLHSTISKNLMEQRSIRISDKSARSNKSNKSGHSLRSEHRRVAPEDIEELHRDPEVQAELSSICGSWTRSIRSEN